MFLSTSFAQASALLRAARNPGLAKAVKRQALRALSSDSKAAESTLDLDLLLKGVDGVFRTRPGAPIPHAVYMGLDFTTEHPPLQALSGMPKEIFDAYHSHGLPQTLFAFFTSQSFATAEELEVQERIAVMFPYIELELDANIRAFIMKVCDCPLDVGYLQYGLVR